MKKYVTLIEFSETYKQEMFTYILHENLVGLFV